MNFKSITCSSVQFPLSSQIKKTEMSDSEREAQAPAGAVETLLTDIFGDSDDDNDNIKVQSSSMAGGDDLLDDSDDEDFTASKRNSRLKKGGSNTTAGAAADSDSASDYGDFEKQRKVRKISKKDSKKKRKLEKKSAKEGRTKDKERGRTKRSKSEPTDKNKAASGEGDGHESGDSYDSGGEGEMNDDDRNFIAGGDDEYADIMREYDQDNADFDDERPDRYGSSKKKKSSANRGGSSGGSTRAANGTANQDPLSQTLAEMKNPKVQAMSDSDKEKMVEKMLNKMSRAAELDDIAFSKQEPAVHKLNLLPLVQQIVGMRPLQQLFLDRDILNHLRDWIEPRDAKTLPALTIRKAVYEILLQLPAMPDHLRRTVNERPPIGVTIVMLRKHKMETPENKRVLKELMEKWSRPIFGQSTSFVGQSVVDHQAESLEIREAVAARYNHGASNAPVAATAGIRVHFDDVDTRAGEEHLQQVLAGQGEKRVGDADDGRQRVRTPYSNGFLFTVQPELKNIDTRDMQERTYGETRMKLVKKMGTSKVVNEVGKKQNPRAMDLNMSGRGLKG